MTLLQAVHLFADGETTLPRFRHIGDLTLDLMHHDGRVEDRWLELEPDEFALMWRLARDPGQCPTIGAMRAFPGKPKPQRAILEQLRSKLAAHGLCDVLIHQSMGCMCPGVEQA